MNPVLGPDAAKKIDNKQALDNNSLPLVSAVHVKLETAMIRITQRCIYQPLGGKTQLPFPSPQS
jgi:hypothetical protein